MRRATTLATIIAAAVALGGCYVSLHPLVSDDVRMFEPKLVGIWGADDETWTFKAAGAEPPSRYDIDIVKKGLAARFSGELARFDGLLVLDIEPGENDAQCALLESHEWFQMHIVGVHSFLRVSLDGDRLTLNVIDGDGLDDAIEAKKVVIAHEHIDDDANPHEPGAKDVHGSDHRKLLTAPTRDLQALVRAHGRSWLFDAQDGSELTRRR